MKYIENAALLIGVIALPYHLVWIAVHSYCGQFTGEPNVWLAQTVTWGGAMMVVRVIDWLGCSQYKEYHLEHR